MHVNTSPATVPDTVSSSDGGSDDWGLLLTALADDPFWECQDCGSLEERISGEELPTPQICGTCYNLRLADLGRGLNIDMMDLGPGFALDVEVAL